MNIVLFYDNPKIYILQNNKRKKNKNETNNHNIKCMPKRFDSELVSLVHSKNELKKERKAEKSKQKNLIINICRYVFIGVKRVSVLVFVLNVGFPPTAII